MFLWLQEELGLQLTYAGGLDTCPTYEEEKRGVKRSCKQVKPRDLLVYGIGEKGKKDGHKKVRYVYVHVRESEREYLNICPI